MFFVFFLRFKGFNFPIAFIKFWKKGVGSKYPINFGNEHLID